MTKLPTPRDSTPSEPIAFLREHAKRVRQPGSGPGLDLPPLTAQQRRRFAVAHRLTNPFAFLTKTGRRGCAPVQRRPRSRRPRARARRAAARGATRAGPGEPDEPSSPGGVYAALAEAGV